MPLEVVVDLRLDVSTPAMACDLYVGCLVPAWRLDLVRTVLSSLGCGSWPARVVVIAKAPDPALQVHCRTWTWAPHLDVVWVWETVMSG